LTGQWQGRVIEAVLARAAVLWRGSALKSPFGREAQDYQSDASSIRRCDLARSISVPSAAKVHFGRRDPINPACCVSFFEMGGHEE